jgi:hypothetical protein
MQPGPVMPEIQLVETVAPNAGALTTITQGIKYVAVPKVIQEMVPVTFQEKIVENGVEKVVTKTVFQPVNKTVTEYQAQMQKVAKQWSIGADTATDVAGNKLAKDEVFKRLQPGMAVLVLPPGQKLQPALQRLFSKDAVILSPAQDKGKE